jgi:hypothetical protein
VSGSSDSPLGTDIGSVGVADRFPLVRWGGPDPGEGLQIGLEGAVFAQFDLNSVSIDLLNADYLVGAPITARLGAVSTRLRVYHQSSHLGDELILGGNAPPRISLSYQAIDGLAALQYGGWRVYGGGGYAFTASTPIYDKTGSAQAGFDFVGTRSWLLGMRLTGGVDVKWLEAADWRSGTSVKLGTMVGRYSPDRRGLTFFLEYYDGFAPFGQFFVQDVKYYGATVQFDF